MTKGVRTVLSHIDGIFSGIALLLVIAGFISRNEFYFRLAIPFLIVTSAIHIWVWWIHPPELPPISLRDKLKSSVDVAGEPEVDLVLTDPGKKPTAVARCLRQCYILGIADALSMVHNTPSIVRTAISRKEADYVAVRLSECGGSVDIVQTPKA